MPLNRDSVRSRGVKSRRWRKRDNGDSGGGAGRAVARSGRCHPRACTSRHFFRKRASVRAPVRERHISEGRIADGKVLYESETSESATAADAAETIRIINLDRQTVTHITLKE